MATLIDLQARLGHLLAAAAVAAALVLTPDLIQTAIDKEGADVSNAQVHLDLNYQPITVLRLVNCSPSEWPHSS